jgi:hypothetical protein
MRIVLQSSNEPGYNRRIVSKFLWLPVYISNLEENKSEFRWFERAKIQQFFDGIGWRSEKFIK